MLENRVHSIRRVPSRAESADPLLEQGRLGAFSALHAADRSPVLARFSTTRARVTDQPVVVVPLIA